MKPYKISNYTNFTSTKVPSHIKSQAHNTLQFGKNVKTKHNTNREKIKEQINSNHKLKLETFHYKLILETYHTLERLERDLNN